MIGYRETRVQRQPYNNSYHIRVGWSARTQSKMIISTRLHIRILFVNCDMLSIYCDTNAVYTDVKQIMNTKKCVIT